MSISDFDEHMLQRTQPLLLACLRLENDADAELAPLKSVAQRYSSVLQVAVMNLSVDRRYRDQFNIMGVPTYIVLEEGQETDRMLGKADEATLQAFVSQVLELDF